MMTNQNGSLWIRSPNKVYSKNERDRKLINSWFKKRLHNHLKEIEKKKTRKTIRPGPAVSGRKVVINSAKRKRVGRYNKFRRLQGRKKMHMRASC